jgi:hypothetical protein
MQMKKIAYNSITINLPKNIFQLLFGVAIFVVAFGMPDLAKLALAIASLGIAYSSVYILNDIMDKEEDAKDPDKLPWKHIANGTISVEMAVCLYALAAIAGMWLSFLVNAVFGSMMALLLLLNILHSSPRIRLKKMKGPTIANMTAIEFMKYSMGWFALTSDTSRFPVFFVLMFAVIYTMGYMAYKFKFDGNTIKGSKLLFGGFGVVVLALFAFSFVFYDFPLAMVVLVAVSAAVLGAKHMVWRHKKSFGNMLMTELVIMPLIVFSFMLLAIPEFYGANMALVGIIHSFL